MSESRWMKLPPNEDYPGYKGLHLENDWCAKAGCVPACKSEVEREAGTPQEKK